MLKEFKEFAMRGNVLDMAVGIIIGAAFGTIVNSLVTDVIMPPIGLVLGGVDFTNLCVVLRDGAKAAGPYAALADAKAAGAVTLNYGVFVNAIVSFLIGKIQSGGIECSNHCMSHPAESAPSRKLAISHAAKSTYRSSRVTIAVNMANAARTSRPPSSNPTCR